MCQLIVPSALALWLLASGFADGQPESQVAVPRSTVTEKMEGGAKKSPRDTSEKGRQALRTTVSPRFEKVPLREVFGWLATETGVNLHIDNKRIEDGNLSADLETEVSLRCDDLKAGDVLELFLEYYGLDYDWNDGVIVIAPKESFEPTTQIFDVKELYTSSNSLRKEGAPPPEVSPEDLIDVLTDTIAPSSWESLGGAGSIRSAFVAGRFALTVVNHRRNLGEIERVLKDLQVLVAAHKPPAEGEGPPPADAPATAFDHPVSLSGATPERIQAALQFRVSPKFESTSLLDAVDWIADQIGIPILIDQKAVEDANLTADVNEKSVVMSLTDVSAGTLLSLLFEGKDLKYTVSHGVLQITTTAVVEDEDRLTVRVYDVQPFLSRGDDRNAEIVQLLESIPTLVDPSSWETVGGSATYRLLQLPNADALVVWQTWPNHELLTQRLDELRRVPVVPVSLRPKVKFRTNPPVDRPFDETDEDEPTELASGETSPADAVAVNDFGLKLFQKVRGDTTGNFTFSPASASSMLALAFPGAANETEAALLQLLAPDLDRTAAIERLSRWRRGLVASRPPIGATDTSGGNSGLRSKFARQSASRLLLANRIWTDTMCPTEPDWAATMKEQFASEIGQFDFGDVDGAVKEINDWGRKATRGRIPEIVDKEFLKTRGVFDGRTAFLLASALSLRAEWDSPFEKHKTVRANFHAPGLLQKVEMMHQLNQSSYAHLDGFKALEMSLGSGRWSMLFLLPDRKDANLDDLERQISLEFLAKVEKESERREVRIFLPRFRIESTLELTNALESLGIGPALSLRDADFSRMTNAPVYIDKVRQKTFLNVDEIGMEVAVATLGGAGFGGGFRDPNLEFRADHPFVYLLRDRSSGTIVMIGRFVGPDE